MSDNALDFKNNVKHDINLLSPTIQFINDFSLDQNYHNKIISLLKFLTDLITSEDDSDIISFIYDNLYFSDSYSSEIRFYFYGLYLTMFKFNDYRSDIFSNDTVYIELNNIDNLYLLIQILINQSNFNIITFVNSYLSCPDNDDNILNDDDDILNDDDDDILNDTNNECNSYINLFSLIIKLCEEDTKYKKYMSQSIDDLIKIFKNKNDPIILQLIILFCSDDDILDIENKNLSFLNSVLSKYNPSFTNTVSLIYSKFSNVTNKSYLIENFDVYLPHLNSVDTIKNYIDSLLVLIKRFNLNNYEKINDYLIILLKNNILINDKYSPKNIFQLLLNNNPKKSIINEINFIAYLNKNNDLNTIKIILNILYTLSKNDNILLHNNNNQYLYITLFNVIQSFNNHHITYRCILIFSNCLKNINYLHNGIQPYLDFFKNYEPNTIESNDFVKYYYNGGSNKLYKYINKNNLTQIMDYVFTSTSYDMTISLEIYIMSNYVSHPKFIIDITNKFNCVFLDTFICLSFIHNKSDSIPKKYVDIISQLK
jgi:hypothetical protein